MSDTLQQAISLIQAGDRKIGKLLLTDVLRDDPENERAWLWLTVVLVNPKQRRECLEQVLKINPHNQSAIEGLILLQKEKLLQEEQYQRRESLGLIIGPIGGLFSGIISPTVFYLLLGQYLYEWLTSGLRSCNGCGLGGLIIGVPAYFIVIALSLSVGYWIGSYVYTWLRYPNPDNYPALDWLSTGLHNYVPAFQSPLRAAK